MITTELLRELKEFVDKQLYSEIYLAAESIRCSMCAPQALGEADYEYCEFDSFIASKKKLPFNKTLFELIDNKGATDAEVYKKAGIDRRLFSKIRGSENYRPGKNTIISLALALELDKDKTNTLLGSAGYTLSDSETFDLVIQFCLEKKIYNVHDVNMALDYFSLKPLTAEL